jgi:anaerobic magnesium-protoporphyrin IX monomethyl ester cyclase
MRLLLTHGYFVAEDAKEQKIMKPYVPLGDSLSVVSPSSERLGHGDLGFDVRFA